MNRQFTWRPRLGLPPAGRHAGFTLVELMVTLAIAAVLMVLAVPNLNDATLNGKLRSQANAFLATLHLARSEAIKRNGRVVVCKSADGETSAAGDGSGGWDQGWMVFHDRNNNGVRDNDEDIIERHQPLAFGFSLTGNANIDDYISFNPSGASMLTSGAFQSGTLTLCRSVPTLAGRWRKIVVSAAGRARIEAVEEAVGAVKACP